MKPELTPESKRAIAMRKLDQEIARRKALQRFNDAKRTSKRFLASFTAAAILSMFALASLLMSSASKATAHEGDILTKSELKEQHKPLPKILHPKAEKHQGAKK